MATKYSQLKDASSANGHKVVEISGSTSESLETEEERKHAAPKSLNFRSKKVEIIFIVCFQLVTSISMTLVNKAAVQYVSYPITLLVLQTMVGVASTPS